MKSATSLVARQYRLQEWAMQIKDCQNRPTAMKVEDWCKSNGMTKACYYYRLRKVREACLDTMDETPNAQEIVDISDKVLGTEETTSLPLNDSGLDICFRNCSVRVSTQTSLSLLSDVIRVITHAE